MKSPFFSHYRPSLAKHCIYRRYGPMVDEMERILGRSIAIKMFDLEEVNSEEDFYKVKWGDDPEGNAPRKNSLIWDASQIQNICAKHGLAPRVYGLTTVNMAKRLRPCQIVQPLTPYDYGCTFTEVYYMVVELGKKYGFSMEKEDVSDADVVAGKLVDFQTFAFNKSYKDFVKNVYVNQGKYGKVYYQDVPELGFNGGPRKTELRIKELGLDRIDFEGKSVVDIGCAGGAFTRYASARGAKQVTGIDLPEPIEAAWHVANLLGFWTNDYIALDLQKHEWDINADIAFFLSMNYHVGLPEQLATAKMLVFEDNGKESRHNNEPPEQLQKWFPKWELIGRCSDHGGKAIYHLYRG